MEFKVKQSGFPVVIGELEFFFGTSTEELTNFFTIKEEADKKIAEIQAKIKELKPTSVDNQQDAKKIVELIKELGKVEYDALLGEGAYDSVYEKYPDAEQLLNLFDSISEAIAEQLEKNAEGRQEEMKKRKKRLLQKKALKDKK